MSGRVVVIVVGPGARSLNEFVRLGYAAEAAMDCDASNHASENECAVEVAHAESEEQLRLACGEAAMNNEWLGIIRRDDHVRGAVIGPAILTENPILAAMVEASRKRGDA